MKKKSFMILLIFLVFSTIVIWLFNTPSPQLRNIVSRTQLQIKNINSKLQVLEQDDTGKELEVESTYLELLGFVKDPNLFDSNKKIENQNLVDTSFQESSTQLEQQKSKLEHSLNSNEQQTKQSRIPPLVTAFSRFGDKENYLIESKMDYFLNDLLLIYDLDLSSSEHLKLKKKCNSSCTIKMFKAEKYPRHVREAKMKAYKPIIIQEVLNEYGSLIWVEPPNVFISNNIDKYLDKSKSSGLLAWPLEEPVSQLTHPLMFNYFNAKTYDFYFVHMLDTSQLIIYNNWRIHSELMLPWVKCALKEDCISPLGSQFSGCDFNRLPEFLYSGCHRYEMSAFSIITAQLFNFDLNKYTMQLEDSDLNLDSFQEKLKSVNTIKQLVSKQKLNEDLHGSDARQSDKEKLKEQQAKHDSALNQVAGSFIQKYYQNSFMTPITLLTKTTNDLISITKNNNNNLASNTNNYDFINRFKQRKQHYNQQYQQQKSKDTQQP